MNATELLRDLAEALASPEAQEDLPGVLRAWASVVRGEVTPDDRYWPATLSPRERRALELAGEGPVTSAQLAEAVGVSRESARLTLTGLAAKGLLRAEGGTKSRRYVL